MLHAIWKARVRRLAAEVEIGLAGMAERPFADAVVKVEQAGLVSNFGARLGWDQTARRSRRNRRLRVARSLADKAARTDRAILDIIRWHALGRADWRHGGGILRRRCRARCRCFCTRRLGRRSGSG